MPLLLDSAGTTEPFAVPTVPIWRITVAQYHEMIRTGILRESDRVELLNGWLVPIMVKNPPHSVATGLVRKAFDRLLPTGWHARSQEPLTLQASEPEPDGSVVRGGLREYLDRHPFPSDTAVVVEVADSSLTQDRGLKKTLYAEAGIPLYWIVNLTDRRVEVHSDPRSTARQAEYRSRQDYSPGDFVPLTLEGREIGRIAVDDILP